MDDNYSRKSYEVAKKGNRINAIAVIVTIIGIVIATIIGIIQIKKGPGGTDTTKKSSELSTTNVVSTTLASKKDEENISGTVSQSSEKIEGNVINKKISHDDDYYDVRFTAPISGKYRFDFTINDVQLDYRVELVDSKNEEIFSAYYSTYEHGVTEELKKGETYTITISQYEGYPEAMVKIHVPSEKGMLIIDN